MKVLVAVDSMKGSLSSQEANHIVAEVFQARKHQVEQVAIADGGEGTVAAFLSNRNGEKIKVNVHNPLGEKISSFFGWYPAEKKAIIEAAAASGIDYLDVANEASLPQHTSSFGTGELILAALNQGASSIVIGLGGSGTVDGGIGLLKALGAVFRNHKGQELMGLGRDLKEISEIDLNNLDSRLKNIELLVAADVTNPLVGSTGTVNIFGVQKGILVEDLAEYESWMEHYLTVALTTTLQATSVNTSERLDSSAGDGAAGGIGFALRYFLGGKLQSGFALIAEESQLADKIATADLVITGEGQIDEQSLYGKVPVAIARLALPLHVPVLAFVGGIKGRMSAAYQAGITEIIPIVDSVSTIEEALEQAPQNLKRSVQRTLNLLEIKIEN